MVAENRKMIEEKLKTVYRHYGNDRFDRTLVKPIKNRDTFNKPYGGFWASRTDAEVSWREWCETEEFETQRLSKHFDFTLKDGAKVLRIKSRADLSRIKQEHTDWFVKSKWDFVCSPYLDFERLSESFDGIEILAGSDRELYFDFYGWDCDSIVIFNADCVKII